MVLGSRRGHRRFSFCPWQGDEFPSANGITTEGSIVAEGGNITNTSWCPPASGSVTGGRLRGLAENLLSGSGIVHRGSRASKPEHSRTFPLEHGHGRRGKG